MSGVRREPPTPRGRSARAKSAPTSPARDVGTPASTSRSAAGGVPARRTGRHGIARVLSKRGLCSRTEAAEWVRAGRVEVDGRVVRDPEFPTAVDSEDIRIDGVALAPAQPLYLMLNKPRGLVTTARDERGRDTVYRCLEGASVDGRPLPWLAPVGRLDQASEGLLLFSNDPEWAARVTDPATGPRKTYRVQVDRVPAPDTLAALRAGIAVLIEGRRVHIAAAEATLLRSGTRNAWLEIVLDEGRNRQIRRLLEAFDLKTLRLIRVAVGGLPLGDLAKGAWRLLSAEDLARIEADAPVASACPQPRADAGVPQ